MSDEVSVRGGVGGVSAELADLRRVAGLLDRCGTEVGEVAGRARGAAASAALLATAVWSPATAARAEAALLAAAVGPSGLTVLGAALELLALRLRTTAGLLQVADSAPGWASRTGVAVGGRLVGTASAVALVAAVPTVLAGSALWLGAVLEGEVRADLTAVLRGDLAPDELPGALADDVRALPGTAVDDAAALLAPAGRLLPPLRDSAVRLLLEHPEITDTVALGLPQAVRGFAGPLAGALPPDDPGLLGAALAVANGLGALRDTPVVVVGRTSAPGTPLRDLAGLMDSADSLAAATHPQHDSTLVRVVEVHAPGGSQWVVQVPGTQEWPLVAGPDPSDLTSNAALMDDGRAALLVAVRAAMREAGVRPGEPVLLDGHSQGGIAAAALTTDPSFTAEFRVTHLVTAGSPIARTAVPDGVQVLALENEQDPVPRLDGLANPDRPTWTTFSRDVSASLAARAAAGLPLDPVAAHYGEEYAATSALADASRAPSVVAFRESAAGFFSGPTTVTDVTLVRPP